MSLGNRLAIDPAKGGLWVSVFIGTEFTSVEFITEVQRFDFMLCRFKPERIVIEQMVAHRGTPNPNDLIDVTWNSAMFCGRAKDTLIQKITPMQWMGSRKKEVTQARVNAELKELEAQFLQTDLDKVKPRLRHNAYDSVGIGLYSVGRLPKQGRS